MGSITLNKPSGGQLTISPEDGATNETVTIPAGGVMPADAPTGKVLQVHTAKSTVNGSPAAGGPNEVSGIQLHSVSFTPVSSSSKIIVQTSSIMAQETSNNGNKMWVGAWADAYQVGCSSATPIYTSFSNNQNFIFVALNHSIDSWGTTPRTISIRAGGDSGSLLVNTQGYSDYNAEFREIGITIMEVAA